jgi:hypothetical protein
MPLSVLPTEPRYWRATCAVALPSLRSPASSITSTPMPVGRGGRVGLQQLDPLPVDGLVVPGRLRQEPLQPLDLAMLGAGDRLGVGQRGQGLVAVAGQQQALQVVAQAAALRHACKQRVELGGVVLQRAGSGWAGTAGGHRRGGSGGRWQETGPRKPTPTSTNYR